MSAILAEITDDPRQVRLYHLMPRVGRPEAQGVEILERLAREFEPALASFWTFLRRVHGVEIRVSAGCEQAGKSQSQLLEPVLHFLEMEIERAEFFGIAQ